MPFLITFWKPIAVIVVILGLGIALKVQTARLASVKQEYAGFKASVKAIGDQALAARKAKEASDKQLKARLDDENKTLRNNLAATGKRLRDYAGSGSMPQFPASTGSADEATINLTIANRALREYFAAERILEVETARILVEGAQGIIDLDAGKKWVKDQAGVK